MFAIKKNSYDKTCRIKYLCKYKSTNWGELSDQMRKRREFLLPAPSCYLTLVSSSAVSRYSFVALCGVKRSKGTIRVQAQDLHENNRGHYVPARHLE